MNFVIFAECENPLGVPLDPSADPVDRGTGRYDLNAYNLEAPDPLLLGWVAVFEDHSCAYIANAVAIRAGGGRFDMDKEFTGPNHARGALDYLQLTLSLI